MLKFLKETLRTRRSKEGLVRGKKKNRYPYLSGLLRGKYSKYRWILTERAKELENFDEWSFRGEYERGENFEEALGLGLRYNEERVGEFLRRGVKEWYKFLKEEEGYKKMAREMRSKGVDEEWLRREYERRYNKECKNPEHVKNVLRSILS